MDEPSPTGDAATDRGTGSSQPDDGAISDDGPIGDSDADEGAPDEAGDAVPPLTRGTAMPASSAADDGPRPVWISLPEVGVEAAPVIDVGVEPDGQMEIPGAREVGWYRFGASPGEAGSSVLAAHIAFDGVDGVFRDLDEMSEGDLVTVGFDDGSAAVFVVRSSGQYLKEDLPRGEIFARGGDPRLVLVTCGGGFNEQLRRYDSNVVLYAEPVE